jgi:predicted nucleic acid-binding protein
MRFVLDASVALAWFIDNPVPAYAMRIRQAILGGDRALVPALWHLEMANGLAMAERRRILPGAAVISALSALEQLLIQAIDTQSATTAIRTALSTARAFRLSAYDAVYLDLARDEALALATLDHELRTATAAAGVALFR